MEVCMRAHFRVFLALLALIGTAGLRGQASAAPPPQSVDAGLFRTLARQQNPVVVAVRATKWLAPGSEEDVDLFERFFSRAFPRGLQLRRETGSGILISPDGEILTNDHVIAGADVIDVQLHGHATSLYRAKVVGRDPVSDSALIKLVNGPGNLPVATLGDSEAIAAGDWVLAIGNPYQLGHSVSVGVVSYARRNFEVEDGHWQPLIQTDASINPGSSGGPLLNTRGEVVGISLAVVVDALGDSMGIGFAVPINTVKAVLPQLRTGRVVRGSLGVHQRMALITTDDATALGLPAARGALIASIDPASSAEAAGLRVGDVVVEFFGATIETGEDLMTRVALAEPGSRGRIVLIRDGKTCAVDVDVRALTPSDVHPSQRSVERSASFGLVFEDAPAGGSLVREVAPGSAAEVAGVEPGDILRKVNTRGVRTAAEAEDALKKVPRLSTAFLVISRDGADQLLELHAY
jgi:serine protease Do